MALGIKTARANQLARSLGCLTGESMIRALTVDPREGLDRERRRKRNDDLV
jgi:hypothetical protein